MLTDIQFSRHPVKHYDILTEYVFMCCSMYWDVTLFLAATHIKTNLFLVAQVFWLQWRTGGGGRFGGFKHPPPPEIPKALQNRAKLNPIVKT